MKVLDQTQLQRVNGGAKADILYCIVLTPKSWTVKQTSKGKIYTPKY